MKGLCRLNTFPNLENHVNLENPDSDKKGKELLNRDSQDGRIHRIRNF